MYYWSGQRERPKREIEPVPKTTQPQGCDPMDKRVGPIEKVESPKLAKEEVQEHGQTDREKKDT